MSNYLLKQKIIRNAVISSVFQLEIDQTVKNYMDPWLSYSENVVHSIYEQASFAWFRKE